MSTLRFALRQLAKTPGFTTVAVFTLALGIGVNATIFGFVRDAVLRPLARDNSAHLTSIYVSRVGGPAPDFRPFSYAEFTALRDSPEVFSDVAAMYFGFAALGRGDDLKRRLVCIVSENYFTLLETHPIEGRFFTAEESRPGAGFAVAVASHVFWERSGRPTHFIGSTVQINQRNYTIIGITPPGFGGLHSTIGPDVWLPLGDAEQFAGWDMLKGDATQLGLIGSLQADLSMDAARARLSVVNHRLNAVAPAAGISPREVVIGTPPRFGLGNVGPDDESFLTLFATLAMGLSISVLLIACLNLASMLLARGVARQKETAIRFALGATRWRVVRQMLAEGFLLAIAGGAAGLLLSVWCGDLLVKMSNDSFSSGVFALNVHPFVDGPIIAATILLCLIATVGSSLVPALRSSGYNVVDDLKQQPGSATTGRWNRFFSLRHCLVMAQIALSMALLFSAGLFIRGSSRARSMDTGFRKEGQLIANLDFSLAHLPADQVGARQRTLLGGAVALPGVASAALASSVPFNFELSYRGVFRVDENPAAVAHEKSSSTLGAAYMAVSRDYFSTMEIPLLRGRDFTDAESTEGGGQRVAIIDEALARSLFGEADPLGRYFFADESDARSGDLSRSTEIIGLVRSPRDDVFEQNPPRRVYRPLGQAPEANIYLHVKASTPALSLAMTDALRYKLRGLDSQAPLVFIRPLAEFVDKNINLLLVRLAAIIFGVFGGIALVLAIVGVYGVKTHAVAGRTREIGIRRALGAQSFDVISLIMKQGVLQTLVGLGVGLIFALIAGQILSGMVYRVNPADPLVLVVTVLLLTLTVLLACWLPARHATKVDPMIALRAE